MVKFASKFGSPSIRGYSWKIEPLRFYQSEIIYIEAENLDISYVVSMFFLRKSVNRQFFWMTRNDIDFIVLHLVSEVTALFPKILTSRYISVAFRKNPSPLYNLFFFSK